MINMYSKLCLFHLLIEGCWSFCWWSIGRIRACEWCWYYRKWGLSQDPFARKISEWRNKSTSSGSWYSSLFFYTCVSLKITQLHLQIVDLALEGSPRIFWYGTLTRWMFFYDSVHLLLCSQFFSVLVLFFLILGWSCRACSSVPRCGTWKSRIYGLRNAQSS